MASARFGKQKDRPFRSRRNTKGELFVTKGKLITQLSPAELFKMAEQRNTPKDAAKARKEIHKRRKLGLIFPELNDASLA